MEWVKHKGCLTQMGGKMFHMLEGIGTDGGFSLYPSSECTGLHSWDSGEIIWFMTFGIQIITELLEP